jgi:hypothetical protein
MSDYPTNEELERIKNWAFTGDAIQRRKYLIEFMEFVKELWHFGDWGWKQKRRIYYISTGGWSGNESIITAMQQNWIFWVLCWVQSRRGGHYIFELPVLPKKHKNKSERRKK